MQMLSLQPQQKRHQFFIYVIAVVVIGISVPSNQQQIVDSGELNSSSGNSAHNFNKIAQKLLLEGVARNSDNMIKSVPYIRASIPMRIYECIREFTILRCTKLFVLQKMEGRQNMPHTGNITRDFLDQFFGEEEKMGSLTAEKYTSMSEKELNQRLVINFQRFFKNRNIKLHFLPGIMVKIIPSKENKLKFTLKKTKTKAASNDYVKGRATAIATKTTDETDENVSAEPVDADGGETKKNRRKNKKTYSYKHTILQMAVPVMIMPAILMGSFLPFVLPVLKMATIWSMILNNSAFIAALIYAARTHANSQDEQQISYGHPGYH